LSSQLPNPNLIFHPFGGPPSILTHLNGSEEEYELLKFNKPSCHRTKSRYFAICHKPRRLSTTSKTNDGNLETRVKGEEVPNRQPQPTNPSILSKEAATASADHPISLPRRLLTALPPAIAIHLSIGSVYVYSMWTPSLSKTLGVVAAAPADWTHSQLLPVFSCAAVVLGATTSRLGEWVERVGPRTAGMVGSAFWGGALVTSAAGVYCHEIGLVYLGYGVLGGVGWGLMYLTPVTSVMKWFPDRRGLATGLALSAFGAGAALAPTLIHTLIDSMAVGPEFIGQCFLTSGGPDAADLVGNATATKPLMVELTTLTDGSQVIASHSPVGEPGRPVVVATESDIAKCSGLVSTGPGVYAIGTGNTGVAKAMASLGVLYGVLGAVGSRFMKIPHPDWTVTVPSLSKEDTSAGENNTFDTTDNHDWLRKVNFDIGLPASYVTTNTMQFPLLWLAVFGNATGGLALLSSSKLMLTDIFAGVAPDIVTPAFTTGYVSALGLGMSAGRFGWSAMSDLLGRKQSYALFGLGIPIVGMTPYLCHTVVEIASGGVQTSSAGVDVWPYLMTFYSGSVLAITFYGGVFSILPAYIADLFGQKHAGAIHGKALTAWAASAVCGPMGLAYLRSHSQQKAIQELLEIVNKDDETIIKKTFGCSFHDDSTIQNLIDAKTLTIEKLMHLAPAGTVDPTPFLYDSTCYVAAGLMSIAALSNLLIRPLDLNLALKNLQGLRAK
ncbi:hypothetical protein ACHAXS_008993, partial [Conticribra weissflogii]